jgi:membrane protein
MSPRPGAVRRTARLVRDTTGGFLEDGGMDYAASVSFHVLLSVFPLLVLATAIGGHLFLGSAQHRRETVDAIVNVLPLSSSGAHNVRRLVLRATSSSGAFSALSAVGLVWASTGMMAALRTAVNRAWRVEATRPFLRGKLWDVLLVAAFGLVLLGLSAAVVVTHLPVLDRQGVAVALSVLVPLAGAFVVFGVLYRLLPARRPGVRAVATGAGAAAVGLVALQHGFALYVTDLGSFNRVYGSLAAPVALLFFVYLSAIVVLWCAHLAAQLDQPSGRARETPTRRSSASARSRTRPLEMSRQGSGEISRRRW